MAGTTKQKLQKDYPVYRVLGQQPRDRTNEEATGAYGNLCFIVKILKTYMSLSKTEKIKIKTKNPKKIPFCFNLFKIELFLFNLNISLHKNDQSDFHLPSP